MHFTALLSAISVKNLRIRPGHQYIIEAENLPFLKKLLMFLVMKAAYVYKALIDNTMISTIPSQERGGESVNQNN